MIAAALLFSSPSTAPADGSAKTPGSVGRGGSTVKLVVTVV